ncbi:oxoprolinase [Schizosaccharomyces cryophilus OY26]|uniref:Oxoprolinase n=1 Tax=Schizosaccharomyces cryophilus (strain OY26 / ATCC MYA-4695 / CBS 11777 / NBRC 106824 / NRRL Y48691) TaxID=653667 RepID=S9VYG7_SCHCR|nr:oxoprolinase [Schizosaccharomyces cryophilus OY26]EPY52713.1 oxoprolinase [Schizosaccharomyces cryophilus OY26]
MSLKIHIDRGGTFTDVIATVTDDSREPIVIKLLSEDPNNYEDASIEAVRRVLEIYHGKHIPRNEKLDTSCISHLRCGTTVATNALLERKGERCAFVTTKGFKDGLIIGNQSRPNIFELAIRRPDVLYSKVIEVDERVTLEDFVEDPTSYKTNIDGSDSSLVLGRSGEAVRILKKIDEDAVRKDLQGLRDEGFTSVAICLAHSFTFPDHEIALGKLAKELGFSNISLSTELMPMIKYVPRATSATADAYLSPVVRRYLSGFQSGFLHGLKTQGHPKGVRCEFMQSDGGLADVNKFSGLRAILSGPAGGVVGFALTSYDENTNIPVIGFDMGGTSTDVSRYGGAYEHVFETTTAGVTIQSPQLDINTVAAGGGSRLFWKHGLFVVGPESAGAHPGPVCYRKGGYLTVTDANLLLGRLLPESFPKIFGPTEDQPLDVEATHKKFQELTDEINSSISESQKMSVDEVAYGFIKIANETMARPIRSLTEAKGHDISVHRLTSFGGAGGQHCVAIAQSLGISQVLVHKYSSILSAYGMSLADVVSEAQEPASFLLTSDIIPEIQERFKRIIENARKSLNEQGFADEKISYELFLNLRYQGTDSPLMITKPAESWNFKQAFLERHKQEFGFLFDKEIIIDDIRVRASGKSFEHKEPSVDAQLKELKFTPVSKSLSSTSKKVFFDSKRMDCPIYLLENLPTGVEIAGPAIIVDKTQTIVIPPGSVARILHSHVLIDILSKEGVSDDSLAKAEAIDPVYLSVLGSRFMAVAEQMGRALQKTSVSTNVKERLDYSCALFDANGDLVANAPHMPVHLGSMSTCVRKQAMLNKGNLNPGDVLVTNHPSFGGTHLPDITTITPYFEDGEIIFYVASRAHHADIGGILPGSMPSTSKELSEEGASIKSEKLLIDGVFQEEKMIDLLYSEPGKVEGGSGTRCLRDNLNDLKAQVASNQKGINLITTLIKEYGKNSVLRYMKAIQDNAESSVRKLLLKVRETFEEQDLYAEDFMDDGSRISLRITIDGKTGDAIFDFDGTTEEVYGNTNAPEAVTYSAIIYCLRVLVSENIPLNQGCLLPIKVKIPDNCFLKPSETAAVVGGNVLTSQRITDTILKAFQACAASQGDTNNLTFGMGGRNHETGEVVPGFGYYETICGGSGACDGMDGTSGVHTHMTNTRITDLEVFERRYPVILKEFSIRKNSGGAGKYKGGDGVVRDIEFRIPVTLSILSERRAYHPYGMKGGEDAKCGKNIWVKYWIDEEGKRKVRRINLGGRNTCHIAAGDHIEIHTPGGGGYGLASERIENKESKFVDNSAFRANGSLSQRHYIQHTN